MIYMSFFIGLILICKGETGLLMPRQNYRKYLEYRNM